MRTLFLSLLSTSAWAADCPAPYTTDALLADVTNAEEAMRAGDDLATASHARALEGGLPCMNELLPPTFVGRVYRAVGTGWLAAGDEGRARQWFATAVEVDPTFEFGVEDLPADHEAREVHRDLRMATVPPAEALEGLALAPGATHWLDGRKLTEPAAVGARPHVYQLQADEVRSFVIRGNAFPGEATAASAPVASTKRPGRELPVDPERPCLGQKRVGGMRVRPDCSQYPPERDPLLAAGIAGLLGAGGLYGYSVVTRDQFSDAQTLLEVEHAKNLTNQLIIASAGVAAVSAAGLTWGLMIDGGVGPMGRVRF